MYFLFHCFEESFAFPQLGYLVLSCSAAMFVVLRVKILADSLLCLVVISLK